MVLRKFPVSLSRAVSCIFADLRPVSHHVTLTLGYSWRPTAHLDARPSSRAIYLAFMSTLSLLRIPVHGRLPPPWRTHLRPRDRPHCAPLRARQHLFPFRPLLRPCPSGAMTPAQLTAKASMTSSVLLNRRRTLSIAICIRPPCVRFMSNRRRARTGCLAPRRAIHKAPRSPDGPLRTRARAYGRLKPKCWRSRSRSPVGGKIASARFAKMYSSVVANYGDT